MFENKSYVNIIFISNDWEKYHRKAFTNALIKEINVWSDIVLVQLPISLLVHIFTNFKGKILRWLKGGYKTCKIGEKTFLFTPILLFHYLLWKNTFFFKIDSILFIYQLNRFIRKNYKGKKIITWYYFPYLLKFVKKFKADLKIYDQYDIYHMNIMGNIDNKLESMNNDLIRESDMVFCTSEYLYDISKRINKNSFYITNGNDFELLSKSVSKEPQVQLPIKGAKTIGYLGGIRDWMDFELLNHIVEKRKEVNFLFIGGIYDTAKKDMEELLKNENVSWINFVNQDDLQNYLSVFDVGIIPFKTTEFFKSVFPNKFYEYLASEIPVVTTNLPELKKFEKIIGFSIDTKDFLDKCDLALSGYYDKCLNEYSVLAKENSWLAKTGYISNIIKKKVNYNKDDKN